MSRWINLQVLVVIWSITWGANARKVPASRSTYCECIEAGWEMTSLCMHEYGAFATMLLMLSEAYMYHWISLPFFWLKYFLTPPNVPFCMEDAHSKLHSETWKLCWAMSNFHRHWFGHCCHLLLCTINTFLHVWYLMSWPLKKKKTSSSCLKATWMLRDGNQKLGKSTTSFSLPMTAEPEIVLRVVSLSSSKSSDAVLE